MEDEEIRHVVEQQLAAGLQVVTDGEFRRARWHFDFFDGLQGVERYEAEQGIQFNGIQTKARGVRVTGKLGFGDHPMLEDFRYLNSISGDAVAKMTIPSPSVLHFRGGRKMIDAEVYPDLADYFDDGGRLTATPSKHSMMRAAAICSSTIPSGPIFARKIRNVRFVSAATTRTSWRRPMRAC